VSRRGIGAAWPGGLIAASERPLAWWSPAQLAKFAERIGPAWRRWCDDWALEAGPVDAFNAAQTPRSLPGPSGWRPLAGVDAGVAWLGFVAGEPEAAVATLLFGRQVPARGRAVTSIAAEVATEAVQSLHAGLAKTLAESVPPSRRRALAPFGAPPMRDDRAWSGAVRVLARLGGTHHGLWVHLSPECAFGWADAETALRCRERLVPGVDA
jgi:hypothetical protein